MPSVKITELPVLTQLSANNANTVFVAVDKTTNTTSQFSTTTLAGGLFANNVLNVGTQTPSTFPGLIAQFIANTAPYGQVNFENANTKGSMDVVLTADIGDDANNYVDLGINNSGYIDPIYSATKAADGYLLVFGQQGNDYVGNLVLGTAAAETNVVFSVGGTTNLDVVAKMTKNGLEFDNSGYITFDDGSTQTVAASPASVTLTAQANTIITQGVDAWQNTQIIEVNQYAQSAYAAANADNTLAQNAYDVANTASANTIILQGIDLTQNTNITTANNHAWAAFDKANNALANTTSIFTAGDFNVSRRLTTNGTFVLANSNFSATEAAVTISASGIPPATPANDGYMIHISGKNGVPSRVVTDSYGTGAYVVYTGRSARGTLSSPTALQANDVIARYSSSGYGTTKYQPFGVGRIDFVAAENYTDANTGSQIQLWNCPIGSNTLQKIASFNGDSVEFTGTVQPDKGFIYVPTVLPGNQTAFTINFATTSLIKAELIADLTISLSNFVYGKVVEVWLTNTSGNQRTVTHGCTATNSSTNSTTFNMSATSSAYLRYFSIDGDLANTFVTVQAA